MMVWLRLVFPGMTTFFPRFAAIWYAVHVVRVEVSSSTSLYSRRIFQDPGIDTQNKDQNKEGQSGKENHKRRSDDEKLSPKREDEYGDNVNVNNSIAAYIYSITAKRVAVKQKRQAETEA
jgi:hypothetical protein